MAMSALPEPDMYFNNPYEPKITADQGDFYSEAKMVQAKDADEGLGMRAFWYGNFFPDMRATVTQAIESEGIRGEKEKIGIGAGAGAVIGAILGGVKGALAGILIGGGGTIVATEGKDVELPAGTVLRVRLDSPLQLQK